MLDELLTPRFYRLRIGWKRRTLAARGIRGERKERLRRPALLAACVAFVWCLPAIAEPPPATGAGAATAETPSAEPAALQTGSIPEQPLVESRAAAIETARQKAADQLADLRRTISLTQETVKSLDAEIDALGADRDKIRQAMIDAAAAQKTISLGIATAERRLGTLTDEEATVKTSLRARRGLLAEVLGALERMGRKPPPALLVKPEDALGSVRSAILLGAVVPSIRKETDALVADLQRLASIRKAASDEKARYVAGLTRQKEEETRLAKLFDEKQKLEATSRDRREAERQRAAELASRATSLNDLIASLETELQSAKAAEDAARRQAAEDARKRQDAEAAAAKPIPPADSPATSAPGSAAPDPAAPSANAPSYDIASLRRDMQRLAPAAAFSTLKGRLSQPVAGDQLIGFGETDSLGSPASGVTFAARGGDVVTAPADASVLYSGPFRSYGQLLILNAGDGYHIVLAGMDRIDVDVGQFVLAGEPVAVMGVRRLASASGSDFAPSVPSLYVEFRKDGKPVDPAPWWSDGPSGRTRNDS